jgi:CDGSH-type Zn-finger protein
VTMDERAAGMKIVISPRGPYLVSGGVPLIVQEIVTNDAGESVGYREVRRYPDKEKYALCRCGMSDTKPYCDGTHTDVDVDLTETASRAPYLDEAACIYGPNIALTDARKLCAEARFCDRAGGLWNIILRAEDPETIALVEEEASLCPAGRYVACDAPGVNVREPDYEPSIVLLEDPQLGVSGPIFVRGGIPIVSADGTPYEVRNRVTLCRCGASSNKPFCDGSHIEAGFKAGD